MTTRFLNAKVTFWYRFFWLRFVWFGIIKSTPIETATDFLCKQNRMWICSWTLATVVAFYCPPERQKIVHDFTLSIQGHQKVQWVSFIICAQSVLHGAYGNSCNCSCNFFLWENADLLLIFHVNLSMSFIACLVGLCLHNNLFMSNAKKFAFLELWTQPHTLRYERYIVVAARSFLSIL